MKIIKENKVQEAVKPSDVHIQFAKKPNGLYQVYVDGHKFGKDLFDEDDVEKFIKLKLDFMKKFEALLK
jgi:hypothetical protein